jgi:hypothetical protein
LEESDWIVIDEKDIVGTISPSRVTVLNEEDYLLLFDQFNIPLIIYESFLQSCFADYRKEKDSGGGGVPNTGGERYILRLFAVTYQFFAISARALKFFPDKSYSNLLKRISEATIDLVVHLSESVVTCLNPWFMEVSLEQHPLEAPVFFNNQTMTSIQAELDACVYRVILLFLQYPRSGAWVYMPKLNFLFVSGLFYSNFFQALGFLKLSSYLRCHEVESHSDHGFWQPTE